MAANFAKLPELLRYLVAADERGVRWLQPHIHDSPRKFRLPPNSGRVVGHHRTHAYSRVDDKKQCEPHQLH